MDKIDTKTVNGAIDLRHLAARYTELKPWSPGTAEEAGACPKCGGKDRFHARSDAWCCYQCYPWENGKPHDAIAFVQWAQDTSFLEACRTLSGDMLPQGKPRRAKPKPHPWRSDRWQSEARRSVDAAVKMLGSDAGKCGREYLSTRGITAETWEAFGLGFAMRKHKRWERKAAAVVIPWVIGETITAVKYRFIEATEKPDRFTSKGGGEQSLFGLSLVGKHFETLILVEGELNALSLWQALRENKQDTIDVVSFGSEGGGASSVAVKVGRRYRRVVVWTDKGDVSAKVVRAIGSNAQGLKSPSGLDANDLLQRGLLAEFVTKALDRLGDGASPKAQLVMGDGYPVTMLFPPGAKVATIEGQWQRLANGGIRATYETPAELAWCLLAVGCDDPEVLEVLS